MRTRTSRRSLAVIGCVSALVIVAGCGSDDPEPGSPGAVPSGVLEVWSRSGPSAAQTYEALFEAFTEHTGIEVQYLATVEFETQLQARTSAQDLPDVLIYDQSSMASYAERGILREINPSDIEGHDQVSDLSWESTRMADGTHYAVPFSQHTPVTFIRKDWREALGMELPTTHEELLELGHAFIEADQDVTGTEGETFAMAIPGTTDRGFFTWWASSYLWQRGGDIVSGGDGKYAVEINSPESVEAVEWIKDLFCTPNMAQPGALTNASATPFFAEGRSGIYQTGPYAFSDFDNNLGADKYEVIAAPAGPGGTTALTERTSIYFSVSSELTAEQDALASFLISAEGQELGMTGPGQPVVRLPINETVDAVAVYGDPRWEVVQEQLADSRLLPSDIDFTVIRQDVAETLNSMFSDCSADVAPALDDLAERISDDLASRDALHSD